VYILTYRHTDIPTYIPTYIHMGARLTITWSSTTDYEYSRRITTLAALYGFTDIRTGSSTVIVCDHVDGGTTSRAKMEALTRVVLLTISPPGLAWQID
jgi:hypothetical protein